MLLKMVELTLDTIRCNCITMIINGLPASYRVFGVPLATRTVSTNREKGDRPGKECSTELISFNLTGLKNRLAIPALQRDTRAGRL